MGVQPAVQTPDSPPKAPRGRQVWDSRGQAPGWLSKSFQDRRGWSAGPQPAVLPDGWSWVRVRGQVLLEWWGDWQRDLWPWLSSSTAATFLGGSDRCESKPGLSCSPAAAWFSGLGHFVLALEQGEGCSHSERREGDCVITCGGSPRGRGLSF